MNSNPVLSAGDIRDARAANPKLRERDLANQLGISEVEFVAAWCGDGVTRIDVDFNEIFSRMKFVGEVMALTRNDNAVHEKIGVYDNFYPGKRASMMFGEQIDMRMFPVHWTSGFAVEKRVAGDIRRSLQFFDAHGDAVHKIHLRENSNLYAWQKLIDDIVARHQPQTVSVVPKPTDADTTTDVPVDELRDRWSAMTDTHQFVSIIRKLNISRHQAVSSVGDDYAWQIDNGSVWSMMNQAAAEELPIMCFVGNKGCIQIHSGPVANLKAMGPWLNVMDSDFHLHLRSDRISETWAVRKPTDKGHVTSLEAYDEAGNLIIQFFGKRIEGQDERVGWRFIMENLPRLPSRRAA